ncbi:MAG TPA: HAD family phosphatase [Methylomirabilota bacterium]|nr:HAD family phosphatase [Methylomirabilota bacterium]
MTVPRFAGIEAVLFDMDGVLVDSEPLHLEAARRLLATHGVRYSQEENAEFIGFTDLEIFTILKSRHGLAPAIAELARQFAMELVELLTREAVPLPGVPAVLVALRRAGYRLALASSSTPQVIAATLRALRIDELFSTVVSSVEVGRGKPAPDVFLLAASRLGLPPGRCLVVEDSRNGVLAAKRAGMACVAVPCAATRHQEFVEADLVLNSLEELLPLLPGGVRGTRVRPRPGPAAAGSG